MYGGSSLPAKAGKIRRFIKVCVGLNKVWNILHGFGL